MNGHDEFTDTVHKYRRALFKYCYYRLQNDILLTETTVDDVISVLYRKWDGLSSRENIRAYLYRIADKCIKHNLSLQRRNRFKFESLEELEENNRLEGFAVYDEYFTEDILSDEEYLKLIREALPDEYKTIFTYRYVENKTLMDISGFTGIPYSSLRLRISKLEILIKKEIEKIFH